MMQNQSGPQPARHIDADSPVWIGILMGMMVLMVVIGIIFDRQGANGSDHHTTWVKILGVMMTLGIFTILYRENPVFRFLEHIYIGLATGYGIAVTWVVFMQSHWYQPMMPSSIIGGKGGGQWWLIFTALFGLLFLSVYFAKLAWMNRFAFSILMGWVAGAALQMFIGALGPQIYAALNAPPVAVYSATTTQSMNNFHLFGLWWHPFALISLLVLLCVAAYFFFSVEHRARWIRLPSNAGRYFLMITLGAIFGTTVMSRLALLIERLQYVMEAVGGWLAPLAGWVMHFGAK